MPNAPRPILVFAYGNPSRGDDALGPLLLERLEQRQRAGELGQIDLLTDFQLQVEHALDLQGRERVVFVDASASGPAPFSFRPVEPEQDGTYTTHAMSPGAVLRVLEQISAAKPPPTWLLAIRGYQFKLGTPASEQANQNLAEASGFLAEFLCTPLN
ncbi:MAG: hydrogenase maturation protease [Pseudomonadota bacterium]|nr:hydrogenase maturation protease [Pseudomonadota bacterium]